MGDNERILWRPTDRPDVWAPSEPLYAYLDDVEVSPMSVYIPDKPNAGGIVLGPPKRVFFTVTMVDEDEDDVVSEYRPTVSSSNIDGHNTVCVVNPWTGPEVKPGGDGYSFEFCGFDLSLMETMRDDLRRLMELSPEDVRRALDALWYAWFERIGMDEGGHVESWFDKPAGGRSRTTASAFRDFDHWEQHRLAASLMVQMDPSSEFRMHCEARLPGWPGTAYDLFATVAGERGCGEHPDVVSVLRWAR